MATLSDESISADAARESLASIGLGSATLVIVAIVLTWLVAVIPAWIAGRHPSGSGLRDLP